MLYQDDIDFSQLHCRADLSVMTSAA